MTKLDFPDTPSTGAQYGSSGTQWRWDGTRWGSTAGAAGAKGLVAPWKNWVGTVPVVGNGVAVAIPGIAQTFSAKAGRTYRCSVSVGWTTSTQNDDDTALGISIFFDGVGKQAATIAATSRFGGVYTGRCHYIWTQTNDATIALTVTGQMSVSSSGATAGLLWSSATMPMWSMVEDITYEAGTGGPVIDVARLPKGLVNFTSITAAQGGFPTTPVNIATAMTHLFDATRNYEIRASIPVCVGATATVATCALIASGGIGTLTNGALQLPSNGELGYLHLHWIGNIVNSITLNVSLKSNAGTVTHNAAATAPSTIALYDLGAK